jgi:hypothetical protein
MHPKNNPAPRAGQAICGLGLAGFLLGAILCFVGLAAFHPGLAVPAQSVTSSAKITLLVGSVLLIGGWLAFFATVRHLPVRRRSAGH